MIEPIFLFPWCKGHVKKWFLTLSVLTLKFIWERCLGNLHAQTAPADWESLVCLHSGEVSVSWQLWARLTFSAGAQGDTSKGLWMCLGPHRAVHVTAAPAWALCWDLAAGLLDFQRIVVNLSHSVVQNNFIRIRVSSWSCSISIPGVVKF